MSQESLVEGIRAIIRKFPQVGMSGRQTVRFVDENVFMDAIEQFLKELKI